MSVLSSVGPYIPCLFGEGGGTAGTQGQDVENRPRMLLLNNNFPRQSLVVTGRGRRTLGVCSLSPPFPLIVRQRVCLVLD